MVFGYLSSHSSPLLVLLGLFLLWSFFMSRLPNKVKRNRRLKVNLISELQNIFIIQEIICKNLQIPGVIFRLKVGCINHVFNQYENNCYTKSNIWWIPYYCTRPAASHLNFLCHYVMDILQLHSNDKIHGNAVHCASWCCRYESWNVAWFWKLFKFVS